MAAKARRVVSLLLVLCLLVGSLPPVFATGDSGDLAQQINTGEGLSDPATQPSQEGQGSKDSSEAHSHSYAETVVAATCLENGYTAYECSCGDSYVDQETEAPGHNFSDWIVVAEATVEVEGTKERVCSVCSHTETEIIPVLEPVLENPAFDAMFNKASSVEITEDPAQNLISVAKTQVGYTEAEGEYTHYGDYYGLPTSDWCAMFVGFCLEKAQNPDKDFNPSCHKWLKAAEESGRFRSAEEYVPAAGDIMFLDTNQNGEADHVAIVCEADPGTGILTTIEGNSVNKVAEVKYDDTSEVLGYIPVSDNGHIHAYKETETAASCEEAGGILCECDCGDSYLKDEEPALGHEFGKWTVSKKATTKEEGEKERVCSACGEKETETVPRIDAVLYQANEGAVLSEEPVASTFMLRASTPGTLRFDTNTLFTPYNKTPYKHSVPSNEISGTHTFEFIQIHYMNIGGVEYPAYCIDPGKRSEAGGYTGTEVGSEDSWSSYLTYTMPVATQRAIGLAMLYGYPNGLSTSDYTTKIRYMAATQLIIWEFCIGIRSTTAPYACSDYGLRDSFDGSCPFGTDPNITGIREAYDIIEAGLQTHSVIPSFADVTSSWAPTHTLDAEGKITLTDTNNILHRYTFANGNGLSFSVNGNTLSVTADSSFNGQATIAPTKDVPALEKASFLVWFASGQQAMIGMNSQINPDPVPAYFNLKSSGGVLNIQKTTNTGMDLGSWQVGVWNSLGVQIGTYTTDANGLISIPNLPADTYYVTELGRAGYDISLWNCDTTEKAIAVTAGQTSTLTLNNTHCGRIRMVKNTNTGVDKTGWFIQIFRDAACNDWVGSYRTGADGTVTSENLVPGTYYVKEYDESAFFTFWKYDSGVKTVNVTAGNVSDVNFNNVHHGRIKIIKETNTGVDRTGWYIEVFTDPACNNWIGGYRTGADGSVTTENLVPGTYYVKEYDESSVFTYWKYDTQIKTVTVAAGEVASVTFTNIQHGKIQFVKETNTGDSLGGWTIELYSDAACTDLVKSYTTGADGKVTTENLLPGTYYAKEKDESADKPYWEFDSSVKTIEVVAGQTTSGASTTFTNIQHGRIEIVKTLDTDGPLNGWEFKVTRLSDNEDMGSFITDDTGKVTTGKLLPGKYKVEEIIPDDSLFYCKTEQVLEVDVTEGQGSTATFTNALRPGKIVIEKVNLLGQHLAGAKFMLEWSEDGSVWTPVTFSDKEDVVLGGCTTQGLTDGTLTTDGSGIITFEGLYPGIQYRVTEVEAPDGYIMLADYAFEGELPVEDLTVLLTVCNSTGYVLPSTGSVGTPAVVLGVFLAGLTAVTLALIFCVLFVDKAKAAALTRSMSAETGAKKSNKKGL